MLASKPIKVFHTQADVKTIKVFQTQVGVKTN